MRGEGSGSSSFSASRNDGILVGLSPSARKLFRSAGVLTIAIRSVKMRVSVVYTDSAVIGTPMRDAAINLRAKPEQRDLIDQAAAMLGKNRSDFMLEAACDRAQSVLLDQVYFRLDDRRFKDFIRQLDAPPAVNEGLERLMSVKVPWAESGSKKASR